LLFFDAGEDSDGGGAVCVGGDGIFVGCGGFGEPVVGEGLLLPEGDLLGQFVRHGRAHVHHAGPVTKRPVNHQQLYE
jgi:hypothetical protein